MNTQHILHKFSQHSPCHVNHLCVKHPTISPIFLVIHRITMPARSLRRIAQRACIQNMHSIIDVGDAPFKTVRSILLRFDTAEHLHQVEQNSPQLIGTDEEAWMELVKRDIPGWQKKAYKPADPKNWYEHYQSLVLENRLEIKQQELELTAQLEEAKTLHDQKSARQVELKGVPLPRGAKAAKEVIILSKDSDYFLTEPHGQFHDIDRDVRRPKAVLRPFQPTKTTPMNSTLSKFRKEAMAMRKFPPKKRSDILTCPSVLAPIGPHRVGISPVLLQEHRTPKPPFDPTSVKTPVPDIMPRKRKIDQVQPLDSLQQREKRLKAMQLLSPVKEKSLPPPRKINVPRRRAPTQSTSASPASTASSPPAAISSTATTVHPPSKQSTSSATAGPQKPRSSTIISTPTDYNEPRRLTPPLRNVPRLKPKKPVNIFMPVQKRQRVA